MMFTTKNLLRVSAITLLALTCATPASLHAQDKSAAAQDASPLAKGIVGTWILVGTPEKIEEAPAKGGRLMFLTGSHWNITQADPETGVTVFHHGGTYTLNGNNYAETVDYANESTKELIKQTLNYRLKLDGDTLTKSGIGNPWNEVWKRVK